MLWLYGLGTLFLSCAFLYVAGELIVAGLIRLSRYFRVTEFVVAFFVMAFAASLPNLFVGITSALQGIPELSFGDIMGNNIIALTLAVALGILFAPKRELALDNDTLQDTSFLTSIAAILPLILIADGMISRSDGLILILFFVGYVYWLFSRRERFSRVFEEDVSIPRSEIMRDLIKVVVGVAILAIAAQGIVYGASVLGAELGLPLVLVGILILGFGGALPEVYFAIVSARKGETGLIVGNLMGAVIIPATLVLGIVATISPIENDILAFPLINRFFLIVIALFFLYVSQTHKVITAREGYILLGFYVLFLLSLFMVV